MLFDISCRLGVSLREHFCAHKAVLYFSHSFLYLSILFMNFICNLTILYKRKLNRHQFRQSIEKLRNKLIICLSIPTLVFPEFLLYFRCTLGAAFAWRCFRDDFPFTFGVLDRIWIPIVSVLHF